MRDDGCLPLVGGVLVLSIYVFWAGASLGKWHGKHIVQSEAVQRGFAEWVVDDQGKSEWKWKE
jgi:hypothetical protein